MKKRRLLSSRAVAAAAAIAAVVLPFAVVRFPPMTDLPQHVLQVRLFLETVSQPSSEYLVQWLSPYGLSYLAIGAGWFLAGPENAGRIGAALIAALWAGGLHWLAAVRRRPLGAALLASTLSGFALGWGFLPFLAGFPLFVWWLQRTEASELDRTLVATWRESAVLALLATALYLTHAQWYAMAALWLALSGLASRLPLRLQIVRGLALVPAGLLGVAWLRLARARSFDSGTRWITEPLERLLPEQLVSAVPGGPRGLGRELVLAAVVLWVGLGVLAWFGARRQREPEDSSPGVDRRLLWAGGLMLVVALCTPEYFMSLWSAKRWWAPGLALVLLGIAPPRSRWGARRTAAAATAVAALVLVLWTAVNVHAWRWFERVELAGLGESLDALPPKARVLGLDYVRHSRLFDGEPFLHEFAYGHAWKAGASNFSFASFPPSPVIFRQNALPPWTAGLEWLPKNVRRSDFAHFDYVLVNGGRDLLEEFPRRAPIAPVTTTEPWRLYRVVPPSLP